MFEVEIIEVLIAVLRGENEGLSYNFIMDRAKDSLVGITSKAYKQGRKDVYTEYVEKLKEERENAT